jgi:taurine dioxygenase
MPTLDVERTLHRVTLIGDRPVGPGGFTSELASGTEFRVQREPAVSGV